MRRLAREAGCTVATLYRYYDRKIDLLRSLWDDVFEEVFDDLDRRAARPGAPVARLEAVSRGYVDYWLDHREHYFLVFMSSGVSQSDVSVFATSEGIAARFSLFYECVGQAIGPDADATDINLRSQVLICSLHGIAHNLITISAFPWADPGALVHAAVTGAVAPEVVTDTP